MKTIRQATRGDLGGITEIYNDAIAKLTATFDTEPKTLEQQEAWFAGHDARHPVIVAEEDGAVAAWASLSTWSDRCAYSDTAEISIYVREDRRGNGLGQRLLEDLIRRARVAGLHTLLARIAGDNDSSARFFESHGFALVGTMREVGRKFGRLLDVHLMQMIL